MFFIILYNMMVIIVTVLMIVTAFLLKGKLKWFLSPILLFVALVVFVIPNISYFKAPFVGPIKISVREGERSLDGVNIIAARGLEFRSGMAHIPKIVWKSVGIGVTNKYGEIAFRKQLKFMNINIGWLAEWKDSDDTLIFALKDNYKFSLNIEKSKDDYTIKIVKHLENIQRRDRELLEYFMSDGLDNKAAKVIKLYYLNNLMPGGKHE
jgi:hypothetical protein